MRFPDPGHNDQVRHGDLWVTWTTWDMDGVRRPSYVLDQFRGLCGSINHVDGGDVPLGQLHPNCIACHNLGHCESMCPNIVAGFTCTVDMDFETQEAGWQEDVVLAS